MNYKYKYAVLGGTFDLLHIGHKILILKAFKIAKFVSIGITSDKFNKKGGKKNYENQVIRRKKLEEYLKEQKINKRCKIIFIDDIFGTTLIDPDLDAIVATKETLGNVGLINQCRVNRGLKRLKVEVVTHAKDKLGKVISSSKIRSGELNPEGKLYKDLLLKLADKKLSRKILNEFIDPLGKIIRHVVILSKAKNLIITVGDITTKRFQELKITPKLSIIDFKTKRYLNPNYDEISIRERHDPVTNSPGQISKSLVLRIEQALKNDKKNQLIVVNGEEDLATIPAILLSPFGTGVYYGQPNKGVVEVKVCQEIKDKICRILGI